jgi:prolyl-tRNA synthetase
MRASELLWPTVKDDPAGAEAVSHKLMLRAGLVRQLGAGIYVYLPVGWKVMQKIREIIRQEMDVIGCQELLMPVINPAEVWQESGRWTEIGEEMFRFKDRKGSDMALAMTHEEVITWIAAREVHSYRQLPQLWYHIQTKERDEARPKSGVLRTREFIMKDSYSLDRDVEGLAASYEKHMAAYARIFARCGLRTLMVQSDPGMMGGRIAHEYMAFSPAGEDEVIYCTGCGYAANLELATSAIVPDHAEGRLEDDIGSTSGDGDDGVELREIHTPDMRTIDQVSAFLGMGPERLAKSLLVVSESRGPLMVLVRGDHELLEAKLRRIVGDFRMATPEEVLDLQGAEAGFIGPIGTAVPILADEALRSGTYTSGANRTGYHVAGITARHFSAEFHDLRAVRGGDPCPGCRSPLRSEPAIEVGNIFQLGTKYSKPMGATFLDEQGEEREIVMGSYGIGLARIAAAAVEQNHDADGIVWPVGIAPYDVQLLLVKATDDVQRTLGDQLYVELRGAGLDVLYDDRELSPGVKFKDADLLGCPIQIVVGRDAPEGVVEIKQRAGGSRKRVRPVDALTGAVEVCRPQAGCCATA